MNSKTDKLEALCRALDVLTMLRAQCPWDKKQTNESLRANTIEEVFELSDAIIDGDSHETCKELGDLLLHVLFYAKIAEEQGQFDIADVCNRMCNKLIFRHPHIYASVKADDAEQVTQNWERIKQKEKDGNKSVLSGVPRSLPSMIKAYRIQDKARAVGFDWDKKEDVWNKVQEEICEVSEAMQQDYHNNPDAQEHLEEEFGDLLFSIINAARLYDVNPDNALERCNRKFINRFNHIEQQAAQIGKPLKELSLDEMENYWQQAKQFESK